MKRSARKSGSSSLCFWIIVPIAPSYIVMRVWNSSVMYDRTLSRPRTKYGKPSGCVSFGWAQLVRRSSNCDTARLGRFSRALRISG